MKSRVLLMIGLVVLLSAAEAAAQRPNRGQRQQRQRQSDEGALKVGQLAPTFDLKSVDGEESFSLKEFRNEKPVVLFFGSYT